MRTHGGAESFQIESIYALVFCRGTVLAECRNPSRIKPGAVIFETVVYAARSPATFPGTSRTLSSALCAPAAPAS
jgi:hypothetical protein